MKKTKQRRTWSRYVVVGLQNDDERRTTRKSINEVEKLMAHDVVGVEETFPAGVQITTRRQIGEPGYGAEVADYLRSLGGIVNARSIWEDGDGDEFCPDPECGCPVWICHSNQAPELSYFRKARTRRLYKKAYMASPGRTIDANCIFECMACGATIIRCDYVEDYWSFLDHKAALE